MAIGMALGFPPLAKAAEVEHALASLWASPTGTAFYSSIPTPKEAERSKSPELQAITNRFLNTVTADAGFVPHAFHAHVLPVTFRGLLADLDRDRMVFYLEKIGHHKDTERCQLFLEEALPILFSLLAGN